MPISHEAMEHFNKHQVDLRGRVDTVAKSVFLLSGGALTLSISIFLHDGNFKLTECTLFFLKSSWCSLFYSMVAFVMVISLTIIRDYIFAEKWRKELGSKNPEELLNKPGIIDGLLWILGVTAIFAFIYGFGSLAYVAQGVISSGA